MKLATAAVIILAVVLSATILSQLTTPAYAVDQTLAALENISTVHLFGRGWYGRSFEMWLEINQDTGLPVKHYLHHPDLTVTLVSTPTGSYQLCEKFQFGAVSKEPTMSFNLRFKEVLEDASKALKYGQKVEIDKDTDPDTLKSIIVVRIENKYNTVKFHIDPETKLPLAMYILKFTQPGGFFKSFDEIYFDEPLPEGIFELKFPEGIRIIDLDQMMKKLHDTKYGIATDGLTRKEAAARAAGEYWQGYIEADESRLHQISPVQFINKEIEQRILGKKKPVELLQVKEPYVEPYCGFGLLTPCVLRFEDGSTKEVDIATIFRKHNGKSSCVVAGMYALPTEIE